MTDAEITILKTELRAIHKAQEEIEYELHGRRANLISHLNTLVQKLGSREFKATILESTLEVLQELAKEYSLKAKDHAHLNERWHRVHADRVAAENESRAKQGHKKQ